ncbi:5627_t:CDS:1, partial [Rhizophagus irregularis]
MGEGKWNMNKPKSFLLYLDANNLYGWAMMQYLPTGNFRWIRDEQKLASLRDEIISNEMENDIPEDYILKVKLAYPRELHPSHTDYHLAIERMKVRPEWLSDKQHELINHSGQRYVQSGPKVTPDF